MIELRRKGSRPDPATAELIKVWMREVLGLAGDAVVMVTELRCGEPGCPDVETVIVVMGEPGKGRHHRLPKPVREVTHFDVLSLAARGTHG
ncbi:MAG: hypothetical protein U0792_12805 [Gemmataceae bacterium]